MATVTPNFNWPVPTSTDLVKDGATAIEALGDSIDASLVDLKGGTTGQVLSKTSGTDMDFTWVTSDDANAIQNTIVDAKGDLIGATAADTPARLAVGTNGQVLTADSTAATGLAWATASAGSTNVAGKNGVLNSNFSVWQRGTSFSGSTGNYPYTADRWQMFANQDERVSRQVTGDTTNLPFIQYCARVGRVASATSTTAIAFDQPFETVNSIPYAGRTVTLSLYARRGADYSGSSNALNVQLIGGTGTDQSLTAGFTGQTDLISSSASLTTTWQRFTFSVAIASTYTQLAFRTFYVPSGTAGAADFYEITGVQLEIAGSASAYSPNTSTYQAELAACQRYYYRAVADTAYGTVASYAVASSSTGFISVIQAPVTMRVSPTSLDFSTLAFVNYADTLYAASSLTLPANNNKQNIFISGSISGATAGHAGRLTGNNNTAAYLGFSAEL